MLGVSISARAAVTDEYIWGGGYLDQVWGMSLATPEGVSGSGFVRACRINPECSVRAAKEIYMKKFCLLIFTAVLSLSHSLVWAQVGIDRSIFPAVFRTVTEFGNHDQTLYIAPGDTVTNPNNGVTYTLYGDGIEDDTPAIQAAIDIIENDGIVFLAEGTYRITNGIRLWKGVRLIGYGTNRPEIVLGANTPGYQSGNNNFMLQFCRSPKNNNSIDDFGTYPYGEVNDSDVGTFHSAVINVNFTVMEGNQAASAIRFRAAQCAILQNCRIVLHSGENGAEDISNLVDQCTFIGGEYGIRTGGSPPAWPNVIMDCVFDGQSEASIRTGGRATIVRSQFKNAPRGIIAGREERLYVRESWFQNIDGEMVYSTGYAAPKLQINLQEVKCENVGSISRFRESNRLENPVDEIVAAPSSVFEVVDFSHGINITVPWSGGITGALDTRYETEDIASMGNFPQPDVVIPDMNAEGTNWVNYHKYLDEHPNYTVGQGNHHASLQAAMDDNPGKVIYLPASRYRLRSTDPIVLRNNSYLVGLHSDKTLIEMRNNVAGYEDFNTPKAIFETDDGALTGISGVAITMNNNDGAVGFYWTGDPFSFINDLRFNSTGREKAGGVWVKDGGSGRFKNLWMHDRAPLEPFLIEGTADNPIRNGRFYQLSLEHHPDWDLRLNYVEDWVFVSFQNEADYGSQLADAAVIENSKNLVFGNYTNNRSTGVLLPSKANFRIRNSENITVRGVEIRGSCFPADAAVLDEDTGRRASFTFINALDYKTESEPISVPNITSFSLSTGGAFDLVEGFNPITEGAVINLSTLGTEAVNFLANTESTVEGSVCLELIGPVTENRTKNAVPWLMTAPDSLTTLTPGSYTLSGIAYENDDRGGAVSSEYRVEFTVVDVPSVASFSLTTGGNNSRVDGFNPIRDGGLIDIAQVGTNLFNFAANPEDIVTGSVRIVLNGPVSDSRTKNNENWLLKSPGAPLAIAPGDYTLTGTVYENDSGGGEPSPEYTVQFKVIDSQNSADRGALNDFVEYAMGGDLTDPSDDGAFMPLLFLHEETNDLRFTYSVLDDLDSRGMSLIAEYTHDLRANDWTPISTAPISSPREAERIINTFSVPTDEAGKTFIRLRAQTLEDAQ